MAVIDLRETALFLEIVSFAGGPLGCALCARCIFFENAIIVNDGFSLHRCVICNDKININIKNFIFLTVLISSSNKAC